jgi:hypothetical protein
MSNQQLMAELAAEYWKLLRAFERAATLAPDAARDRLTAQARYSAGRLDSLIGKAGLRLASFDGMTFEINLPAVAVNAEDVAAFQALVVERTIEPTVLSDSTVILTGKVFLAPASDKEG